MAPEDSFLEHDDFKFDVVVATALASINANLKTYMRILGSRPPKTYCVVDHGEGKRDLRLITLDRFKSLAYGVDPFSLPDGKDISPGQRESLREARFVCAIKLQPGLPGKTELPHPIITWDGKPQLNMYFNQLVLKCSDKPPREEPWQMRSFVQKHDQPYWVRADTSLKTADLQENLNIPYFDMFPEDKAAIQEQLSSSQGSEFRLQQLLLDLALAEPSFSTFSTGGFEASLYIRRVLSRFLGPAWIEVVKEYGQPVLGITLQTQGQNPSSIRIDRVQTVINPLRNGGPEESQRATTLDYLCTVNGNDRPGRRLAWNWLAPKDIANASGVLSIRRSTFTNYVLDQILPHVKSYCIEPWTKAMTDFPYVKYFFGLKAGRDPDVAKVVHRGPQHSYACHIYFSGNEIIVWQSMRMHVTVKNGPMTAGGDVINKLLDDHFTVTVDSLGNLIIKHDLKRSRAEDKSTSHRESKLNNFFAGVNDLLDQITKHSQGFIRPSLDSIPFKDLKGFVFPGAKVFTYKQPVFSNNQDMTCLITYVKPGLKAAELSDDEEVTVEEENNEVVEPFVNPGDGLDVANMQAKLQQSLDTALLTARVSNVDVDLENASGPLTVLSASSTAESQAGSDGMPVELALLEANMTSPPERSLKDLKSTTDLMQNYVQGALVASQGKFRALQTTGGDALLFAVNANGVLNVICENMEKSKTGWTVMDLSSSTLTKRFTQGATIGQFDVGQSVMDGSIGLGMSVRVNGSDQLFLSLFNDSDNVTPWTKDPRWIVWPFDATDPPSVIHITNVYFSETNGKKQYILVDILQDPKSAVKNTVRYMIDVKAPTAPYWRLATLPFEIEANSYQSCIGRTVSDIDDGMYTCGTIAGKPQLGYVPILGEDGTAPAAVRFVVPGSVTATAIASARYGVESPDQVQRMTHFYATAGSTLYNWGPDDHNDSTEGKPLMTNDLFSGTTALVAMTRKNITTIFGKNSSNVVYYTSCPIDKLSQPNAWSFPVPVTAGAEHITGFINIQDGGNTIFVAGANEIQQITQASGSKTKLWQANKLILQAPPKSKPLAFKSYTSTVKLVGDDDLPLTAYPVCLAAQVRTPVYVNGLYYVLSATPISVKSDSKGLVTIIEATEGIIGTIITVKAGQRSSVINPMQNSFDKLAKFTDKNVLRAAEFNTNTKAGGALGAGTKDRLVSSDVSDADVQAVSESMKKLKDAYEHTKAKSSSFGIMAEPEEGIHIFSAEVEHIQGIGDAITMSFGDLHNWLKSSLPAAIQFVKNTATGFLEFIVTIGGKLYRAILDTVEAVVGAVQSIFDKIKTGLQKLWSYLQMLFDWDDIKRTKEVVHKMIKVYLLDTVGGIKTVQEKIDASLEDVKKAVRESTGNKDYSKLGDAANKKPARIASDPNGGQTSGSQMMGNHLRDQAGQMSVVGNLPAPDLVKSLIDDLLKAFSSQQDVLVQVFAQLKELAKEFDNLSLLDVIKRLAGIVGESIIGTTQVVSNVLLKLLYRVAKTAVEVLDTKIHIPIISDILNEIGIPDLSLLDLFTWIAAVPMTVVYKAIYGHPPFPDCKGTKAILASQDLTSFKAAFKGTTKPARISTEMILSDDTDLSRPDRNTKDPTSPYHIDAEIHPHTAYFIGHMVGGFTLFFGGILSAIEFFDETNNRLLSRACTVMNTIASVGPAVGAFMLSRESIRSEAWTWFSKYITVMHLASKVVFSDLLQGSIEPGDLLHKMGVQTGKPMVLAGALDIFFILPQLAITMKHLDELTEVAPTKDRSCAIIDETTTLVSYVSRTFGFVAATTKEPNSKGIAVGIFVGTTLVQSGLLFANAAVGL